MSEASKLVTLTAAVVVFVLGVAVGPIDSRPAQRRIEPPAVAWEWVVPTTEPVPTVTPAPTPTSVVVPTPVPSPTPDAAAAAGYDEVETYIFRVFEDALGEGHLAVRVARCEGWNATANFDLTHISPTDDVGPFQINWVHGKPGGIIAGRWPGAVQTLEGNVDAALRLRVIAGGWSAPWAASQHCWT